MSGLRPSKSVVAEREAIVLRMRLGRRTYGEIASYIGIPVSSVATISARLRKKGRLPPGTIIGDRPMLRQF